MKIIKLNAIDSTNAYLKEMVLKTNTTDYTVVVAGDQTQGRGQMDTQWHSAPFKNLTFSIFTKLKDLKIQHQSYLNFAVSLAILDALTDLSVPKISVKWPNDIMADHKKICGILIETTFQKTNIKNTIIGIGLNVNQDNFDEGLPNASSLKTLMKKEFDLDQILHLILEKITKYLDQLQRGCFDAIYEAYHSVLYKRNTPMMFQSPKKKNPFLGKIVSVSKKGQLIVELDDESLEMFDSKEIKFATT